MIRAARSEEEEALFGKIVEDRVKHSPFYALIGMEVAGLARGEARIRVDAGPRHCDESGYVHPGVVFSLADAASGVAMATCIPRGSRRVVTVEMKANFIAPAGRGELTAVGKVLQTDGDIAVSEAQVRDEAGDLVATSMATFMVLR
ncbi:MAG: PaaI family thioesterase [Actinomycetota bacterium]|nr:PaaI family thioesterase [Actinomycetota bacterium]MDD5667248.1 PaaI family thioesterase [Actinomycetota bacterium]